MVDSGVQVLMRSRMSINRLRLNLNMRSMFEKMALVSSSEKGLCDGGLGVLVCVIHFFLFVFEEIRGNES